MPCYRRASRRSHELVALGRSAVEAGTNLPLHLQAFAFDPAASSWLGSNAEIRRTR